MTLAIKPAPVRRAVTVAASPERAFMVFTADIGRWWPSSHKIGAAPFKSAVIEPRAGGRSTGYWTDQIRKASRN